MAIEDQARVEDLLQKVSWDRLCVGTKWDNSPYRELKILSGKATWEAGRQIIAPQIEERGVEVEYPERFPEFQDLDEGQRKVLLRVCTESQPRKKGKRAPTEPRGRFSFPRLPLKHSPCTVYVLMGFTPWVPFVWVLTAGEVRAMHERFEYQKVKRSGITVSKEANEDLRAITLTTSPYKIAPWCPNSTGSYKVALDTLERLARYDCGAPMLCYPVNGSRAEEDAENYEEPEPEREREPAEFDPDAIPY